ncbi:MAG: O-antigen ligase family protein [Cyanobacteria bacterium HKST-UBA02]|nr:O-antigen ligase family protein [Cyanobacteria bacterium HKST-UBA02]
MSKAQKLLDRLERLIAVLYAGLVFAPITVGSVLLIEGLIVWLVAIILALIEKLRTGSREALDSRIGGALKAPLAVPLLIFSYTVALSGFFNHGPYEAWKSFYSLKAMMVYFWIHQVLYRYDGESRNTDTATGNLLGLMLLAGAVSGTWGSLQQILNFHPFSRFPYLQATGFIGHPMAFAGQMEIASMIALGFLITRTYGSLPAPLNRRPLFFLVTALNFAGLLFASERSAWLGVMAASLFLSFLVSRRMFVKVVFLLLTLVVTAWFTVPVVRARIEPLIADYRQDVSTTVRLRVWKTSLDVFRRHPLVGVGIRHYPAQNIPEAVVPGVSDRLVHAHSNYLHILATLGVIGFAAYIYLIVVSVRTCYGRWRRGLARGEPFATGLGLGCLGAVATLMVAGLFEFNFGTGAVRMAYWFVLALIVAIPASNMEPGPGAAPEAPGGEQTHDHH